VGPLIFLKTQRDEAVAVINPADKLRFGEDSTPRIYANAKKVAEEAGLELRIAADEVAVGGFYARYVNGAVETPRRQTPRRAMAVGGPQDPPPKLRRQLQKTARPRSP
jgi:hypothetical protein